jgi:hypothetical protein
MSVLHRRTTDSRGAPPSRRAGLRARWAALYPQLEGEDRVLLAEWRAENDGPFWQRFQARRDQLKQAEAPVVAAVSPRRPRASKVGVAAATLVAVMAGSVGVASANAANPYVDSAHQVTGTATMNANGSVTVNVQGTWNWGALSGSSVQDKCEGRYGVGWSVDWSGITNSPTPGFAWQIGKKQAVGKYFHVVELNGTNWVTSHKMDGVYPFTGPCTPQELALDPTGPSGPWSASFTYPNAGMVPQQLCGNFYDLHGSPGNINNPAKELDPTQNGDNSIKTNDFDATAGAGYCFTPQWVINLTVNKVNDADGNGTFSKSETAKKAGDAVPFRVTVSNPSPVDVVVDTATDAFSSTTIDVCAAELVGKTLLANNGNTLTCDFPVQNYAPAANQSLTNTVTVSGHEKNNPNNKGSGQSTSTVTTSNTPTITLQVTKANDADGDNTFHQTETAAKPGDPVDFEVTIKNTSAVPVVLDTLTDEWPSKAPFSPTCATAVVGTTLQPNGTATCSFTQTNYAPASGQSLTNTAKVTGHDAGNPNNKGNGQATSTVVTGTPNLTITVDKTNDADGDGTFANSSIAGQEGDDVPFRVVVTNTSPVPVVVDSLTDQWPGKAPFDAQCAATVTGKTLAPGASATCDFTLTGYAPASGTSLTDTATVKVHQENNPGNTKTQQDDSTVTTGNPPAITVDVNKTNDADGNGTFEDTSDASVPGADVAFKVVVTNTSTVPVVVDSLTDEWPGTGPFSPDCATAVVGTTLQPGDSATCSFTLAGYAPAAGQALTDTAKVTVHDQDNPDNTGSGQDDSTVKTPNNPPLSLTVDKTNNATNNGSFTDTGSTTMGATVTFRVVVTNNSTVPVVIDSLTDEWPGAQPFSPQCAQQVVGTTLQPGASATCEFALANYGPAAGSSLTDTAKVIAHQENNPDNKTNGQDDSTVGTPAVLGSEITRTPAAPAPQVLARTGSNHVKPLLELGLLMLLLGGALLLLGRPTRVEALLAAEGIDGGSDHRPARTTTNGWFAATAVGAAWDRRSVRGRWNQYTKNVPGGRGSRRRRP